MIVMNKVDWNHFIINYNKGIIWNGSFGVIFGWIMLITSKLQLYTSNTLPLQSPIGHSNTSIISSQLRSIRFFASHSKSNMLKSLLRLTVHILPTTVVYSAFNYATEPNVATLDATLCTDITTVVGNARDISPRNYTHTSSRHSVSRGVSVKKRLTVAGEYLV